MINIEHKENKIFFTYQNASIKLLNLEEKLHRIRIDNLKVLGIDDRKSFENSFLEYCKEKEIQILTESDKEENSFLERLNFEIFRKKNLYTRKLESIEIADENLKYKSLKELSEPIFLETYIKAIVGYDETNGLTDIEHFLFLKELAEDKFNEEWWKIAYLNNNPIGVILPQIFADNDNEGTLFFIGIIPEYRNKGYAKEMHLKGLLDLSQYGATEYIGSTLVSNQAMNSVFLKNKCEISSIQHFFKI